MLARATAAAAATAATAAAATRRRAASTFASAEEHLAALAAHSGLPRGFKVGSQGFAFRPRELPHKEAKMVVTLIKLDAPTPDFAAMFTSNAFPGAPVLVGRRRLAERALQAVVINNKISNVCAPGGVEDSERLCGEVARLLGLPAGELVLPSSTGVIGWKLPVDDMVAALPAAAATLQGASVLPAAQGIMTTDMYPKVRSALVPGTAGGRIVGIAKGAGMIEPNLATMLVYLLTDVAVPRDALRAALPAAVHGTFNALSIDSDQSTSDTVVLLSSGAVPLGGASLADFTAALTAVCGQLSEDVVRNGEGVQHVMRVTVSGAPTEALARDVGKSIVNSPLFKCAVAGNDPNVGRLVAAIGKCIGNSPAHRGTDVSRTVITMGGTQIFGGGQFQLAPETEAALVAHLAGAQLWSAFVARGAARRGARAAVGGGGGVGSGSRVPAARGSPTNDGAPPPAHADAAPLVVGAGCEPGKRHPEARGSLTAVLPLSYASPACPAPTHRSLCRVPARGGRRREPHLWWRPGCSGLPRRGRAVPDARVVPPPRALRLGE